MIITKHVIDDKRNNSNIMKTKHFLFALTLPAVFAACNNDEFSTIETNKVAGMEAVEGYALLSNGLSINVTDGDTDTRMTSAGEFDSNDRLGLGWVLNSTSPDQPQSETSTVATNFKLYANHLFAKDASGKFTTTGNVYEGWHFAYYPYTYMPKVGQLVIENVNPAQKEDWATDHFNNALFVSAQHFLSGEDVENSKLNADREVFEMEKMVNELNVIIKPSEDFTKQEVLSALRINSITLTANNGTDKPFFTKALFSPRYLPVAQYKKDGTPDVEATKALMTAANIFGDRGKAIKKDGAAATLKTVVEGEQYDLSEAQTLRMFTLPTKVATIANNQISFRINVQGGYFTVKYVAKNPTDAQINNNTKIEKIAALLSAGGYEKDGETYKFSELLGGKRQQVTLVLTKDMFTADYKHIANYEDWKACVAIANALGEKEVTFNATGAIEFPEGDMLIPDAKTTVSTSGKGVLSITKNTNWNDDLKCGATSKVVVAEDGVLNVEGRLEASVIENNGRINAGAKASISNKDANSLTNSGEVFVEYGAYVYPANGKAGVIAYEVKDAEPETIGNINTLIATSANQEYANVNTLVVSTELDLNAKATSGSDDRYNPSRATSLNSLSNVDIRLSNGSVVYTEGDNKEVKSVIAIEGENKIFDIQVIGNVTIADHVSLNVDSKEDAKGNKTTLNLDSDIINKGELYVNTNINCINVDNEEGYIKTDKYEVIYSGTYKQGGVVDGNVNKKPVAPEPTIEELAEDVLTAFNPFKVANLSTLDAVIGNIKTYDDPNQKAFIAALNAWFKKIGHAEVTKDSITKEDLELFEKASGNKFFD